MSRKKLFVHLHIYYFNQVQYFVSKLKNITGCDWDLCVTYCEDNEDMFQAIRTLKADAKFLKVKNIGDDVWAFIQAIRTVNIDDYDYIMKLYTKASKKGLLGIKSYTWRNSLVEFLFNSKKLFLDNLKILDTVPSSGMLCSPYSLDKLNDMCAKESFLLNRMMKRLGLHYRGAYFNAGTMFIARASIYKCIANSDIVEEDFLAESECDGDSMTAVLARMLSLAVYSFGYNICKVSVYRHPSLFLLNKALFTCKYIKNTVRNGVLISIYGKRRFISLGTPVIAYKVVKGTAAVEAKCELSDVKHKRLAIFAAYCSGGKISDYQIYYLKSLKKVVDNIIFVADSDIFPEEIEKIKDLICYCDCSRHGGYDFYSYKNGYDYAKWNGLLDNVNELVICNDSCYGAVYPFKFSFDKMQTKDCDFWGYTINKQLREHIQSFFYVFKQDVFMSLAFKNFISNINKEKSVNQVIKKYEIHFTEYLNQKGFKYASFIPCDIEGCSGHPNKTLYPLTLLKQNCPLVKVKVFNNKFLGDIKEDSFDTLDYIESVNPELAAIIRKDNCM